MASSNSDIALLTEHFGYPPVSLLDDIINSINILAERALNSVEQGLHNQAPSKLGFKSSPPAPSSRTNNKDTPEQQQEATTPEDLASHEIENGTHQLETLLCASIDRNFDKFELYVMQNILCIRPAEPREWIRLGHYEGLDLDQIEDDHDTKPSVDGVRRLRRRLQASQQLNVMLHAERARNEALLGELRAVVGTPAGGTTTSEKKEVSEVAGDQPKMEIDHHDSAVDLSHAPKPPLGFLHHVGELAAGAKDKPLETTAAFTLSQIKALRALSTSLRSLMPDLRGSEEEGDGSSLDDAGGRKSWRRERLEYVETATRKHLEHSRGLELGKDGEVRDGEWQGEGRSLAREEVEGLEKVVAILGGSSGPAGGSGLHRGDEMDES